MSRMNRRVFFGTAFAGTAAAVAGHSRPVDVAPPPRPVEVIPTTVGPHDTLFLTWQRDPTTTMTVQWLAPPTAPADVAVRFAALTGGAWQAVAGATKPFPHTALKIHRAELTGLTPNTEYVFQVGHSPAAYHFRTMPAKATDTFTFVSGGDCGVNAHAVANNILVAKQEPRFALIGGDLAYDNGLSAKTALTFVQNYARHMIDPKGRLIPLVAGIGNHEVRGGYSTKREDATFFLPLFDGLYRDTTYAALDFGDYLSLVLLDSGHAAPIAGDQTDWLAGALKARETRPHLFAVNHVPAYPSYRNPGSMDGSKGLFGLLGIGKEAAGTGAGNRKHWCPLFENHGVDAVLEHHDHTFKRTHPLKGGLRDKYGVPYLGDGSWGQLRAPAKPEKRPYLAAVGKAYHFTVHKLEGEQRYHVALEESGRVADVFGTTGKRPAKRG